VIRNLLSAKRRRKHSQAHRADGKARLEHRLIRSGEDLQW
jgi:hypothetical protein